MLRTFTSVEMPLVPSLADLEWEGFGFEHKTFSRVDLEIEHKLTFLERLGTRVFCICVLHVRVNVRSSLWTEYCDCAFIDSAHQYIHTNTPSNLSLYVCILTQGFHAYMYMKALTR